MAHIYLDIRMGLGKLFQSFRCGNDAHELDVPAAMLFDEIHWIIVQSLKAVAVSDKGAGRGRRALETQWEALG